jgi:hypothetical protein
MKKTLAQLYAEHIGKVSDKWTIYLTDYDRIFDSYRDKNVRLLEIGIQNGGSLEIWSKYFPHAEKILGCDINPDCKKLTYDDQRISVVVGDANSDPIQKEILHKLSEFDIFIDDGSHTSEDIIRSFSKYFDCVSDGGIYIAEDIHCSYWQEFKGGIFYAFSSIAFFKRLADIVSHEHWGLPRSRLSLLSGFINEYGLVLDEAQLMTIHSVEFINSLCVIRKNSPERNILGARFIAGQDESIVPGQLALQTSLHNAVNQETNTWAARAKPSEEELMERLIEIERLEIRLLDSVRMSTQLRDELTLIRNSKVWRLRTAVAQLLADLFTLFKRK